MAETFLDLDHATLLTDTLRKTHQTHPAPYTFKDIKDKKLRGDSKNPNSLKYQASSLKLKGRLEGKA